MASEQQPVWVLVVVEGKDLGRLIHLGETPVTIGRGRDDDLVLHDATVTNGQLTIEWDQPSARHVLVQTGDSATVINRIQLARDSRTPHELSEGDRIQIGGTVLRYLRQPAGEIAQGPPHEITAKLGMLERELPEAVTVLRYASLLPQRPFVLDWLRQLVSRYHPMFSEAVDRWQTVMSRLREDNLLLFTGNNPEEARVPESVTLAIQSGMDEPSTRSYRRQILAFCTLRLDYFAAKQTALRNQIMTGDPNVPVTAWTVPSVEQVRARAGGIESAVVQDVGDGSYLLQFKPESEEEYLVALVEQAFSATDDHFWVEWALKIGVLAYPILREAEARVGQAYVREPESEVAARVSARYWLCMAHASYEAGGSCRGAWSFAGKAVEILEAAVVKWGPSSTNFGELLSEANHVRWTYDD
jgi:hypothetical protein